MESKPVATWSPEPRKVLAQIERRSFAVLATTGREGAAHAAGVLYVLHAGQFYVTTSRTSRKARNVVTNPNVSLCIPIRRAPVGPPSTVQIAAIAEVLSPDDPTIAGLVADGKLASITGHGELDLPDICLLRLTPRPRISTYGLGMSLRQLARDPLNAGGSVRIGAESALLHTTTSRLVRARNERTGARHT